MAERLFFLHGDLDAWNASDLAQELADAIHACDGGLVVDCSDLSFIDSSGLKALLRTQRALADEGRAFRLINASRTVRVICDAVGVTHVLRLRDSTTDTGDGSLPERRNATP